MGEFFVFEDEFVDLDSLLSDQNPISFDDDIDFSNFFDGEIENNNFNFINQSENPFDDFDQLNDFDNNFINQSDNPLNDIGQLNDFDNDSSLSLSVSDLQQLLMNDDEVTENSGNEVAVDEYLKDWINDSPFNSSGEVVDVAQEKEKEKDGAAVDEIIVVENNDDNSSEHNSNTDDADSVDPNDPISKKRKRQLRNRDAAVRSRERKKMYVKDLEMKSRYFEGECRRLGMLLQCYLAENQALRLSLQSGKACDASMTKQESAVLLLESLLLGSLLWFLGIVCLFIQPSPVHQSRGLEQLESEKQETPLPRKPRSENFGPRLVQSFFYQQKMQSFEVENEANFVLPCGFWLTSPSPETPSVPTPCSTHLRFSVVVFVFLCLDASSLVLD